MFTEQIFISNDLFLVMPLDVKSEAALLAECFLALRTLVRLLAAVDPPAIICPVQFSPPSIEHEGKFSARKRVCTLKPQVQ